MKLCSYLSLSRHGIYYFRYPIDKGNRCNRTTLRLSLRTRCPASAQKYARQLGGYYTALKDNGILAVMNTKDIKELITDYFEDALRRSIENVDRQGFSADDKQTYKGVLKQINADIKKGNSKAIDNYTPVDRFRTLNSISDDDWAASSATILPLLREQSFKHWEKVIEYGDKLNERAYNEVVLGSSRSEYKHHQLTTNSNAIPLSQAIDKFIQERSRLGAVGNKHIEEQQSELNLLSSIIDGDIEIARFDGALVRHVRDTLIALPKNRKKNKLTRNLSPLEAIKVEGIERISGKTVNGYLGTYRTFFNWALESKYIDQNPFEKVKVAVKKKPFEDRRQAYTQDALHKTITALTSGDIRKESYRWAALLGLFTGARLAEICQLELANIQAPEGIHCFHITSKANSTANLKNLKSEAATRFIPLHSQLGELGFGTYARSVRARYGADARLFPDFKHHKDKGYTKNFGRWYNEAFIPKLGVKSHSHIFHGLRHTMNTRLLQASVEPTIVQMLLGHSRKGVQAQYFAEGYKIEQLKEAIERFSVHPR